MSNDTDDNNTDGELKKKRKSVRQKFKEANEAEASATELAREWAKESYAIKMEYFLKEKTTENGLKTWAFKSPMKADIKPFDVKANNNANRLPSLSFVQWAQGDSRASHSKNYKYAAAFQYAHEKGWGSEKFNSQIEKEGVSGLQKLYSKSKSKGASKDSSKDATDAVQEKPKVKSLRYYQKMAKKTVWSTKKPLPDKYIDAIAIARIHNQGVELLCKLEEQ